MEISNPYQNSANDENTPESAFFTQISIKIFRRIYCDSVQLIYATLSVHLALCGGLVKLARCPSHWRNCRVILYNNIYVLSNFSYEQPP